MKRRTLLASLAAGGGAVLSGCADVLPPEETGTPTPQRPTDRPTTDERTVTPSTETPSFDRVVDMVEDRGVDPTGEKPIDDALRRAASDGTLLEFPPGRYLVTKPLLLPEAVDFGIRGTGDGHGDVRFVHPTGHPGLLLDVRDGRNCLLENFTADQTGDRRTNTGIVLRVRDGLVVRDVEVAGFTPSEGDGPVERGSIDLVAQVLDPGGVGTVARFTSVGGGEVGVYPDSYPAIYSGVDHRGTLRLVDCHVEDSGGAGVYTSRTFGPVQVTGGRFRNNAVAQIRVSGEGSFIRGAHVVVDTDARRASRGTYETVRGVWWESGDLGKTGGFVEGCRFVARSAPVRRGLLEVDGTAGAMTVRDCEFHVERPRYQAINAFAPGSSPMGGAPERPWGITLENVRVTGAASEQVAIKLDRRARSRLTGVAVLQRGRERDGIAVSRSPGTRIEGSTVDVVRFPIVLSPGARAGEAKCWFALADDNRIRSAAETIPGSHRSLEPADDSACLPSPDLGGGTLVVVGMCDQGYVGAVVGGNGEHRGTAGRSDCS